MCFFRKKKTVKEKVVNDIDLIKANTQAVDVLLVYAQGQEGLTKKLLELQEKIKYLNPSEEEKIHHLDKKIGDKLGDAKIALSKFSQKGNFEGWERVTAELEIAVAERKAKLI